MNVLFVGIGKTGVCWYRCALPARALGADWIGVGGEPPTLQVQTGEFSRRLRDIDDFASYDVVVLQQPRGVGWLRAIEDLRSRGVRVLYEIDDYVHGVRKLAHHVAAGAFSRDVLTAMELAMRACDGVIVSTDYLARRYRAFNPVVSVCRNGLDLGRYELTRRERETVTLGWAGGVGHRSAIVPWLREVLTVLGERPATRFMSISPEGFAAALAERYGAERCISLPIGPLESYPAAMTSFDIALAPATGSSFFRGKSDLRWLESSALGIPLIADPVVYPDIEHGVTGLHAASPAAAREAMLELVDDRALRRRIGEAARDYVREHRSIAAMAPQWAAVLDAALCVTA